MSELVFAHGNCHPRVVQTISPNHEDNKSCLEKNKLTEETSGGYNVRKHQRKEWSNTRWWWLHKHCLYRITTEAETTGGVKLGQQWHTTQKS